MTARLTPGYTPNLYEDYNPLPDADTVAVMLDEFRLGSVYDHSLKNIQLFLLTSCVHFSTEKSTNSLLRMIEALLAYIIHMEKMDDVEVPTITPPDFVHNVLRDGVLLDVVFESRLSVYRATGANGVRNKLEEWKDIHICVARLIRSGFTESLLPILVQVLSAYKETQTPDDESLGFALCRLADLLFACSPNRNSPERLPFDRFRLLYEVAKSEPDLLLNVFLFSRVLKVTLIETKTTYGAANRGIDELQAFERDFLVDLVGDPNFPEFTRDMLLDIYLKTSPNWHSRNLAYCIQARALVPEVPLKAWLDGEPIDEHLQWIQSLLTGNSTIRFHHLTAKACRANFLLLLGHSFITKTDFSCTLLLQALPYCIGYLGGLLSDELAQSRTDPEETLVSALINRMRAFIEDPLVLKKSYEGFEPMNDVFCLITKQLITEPLPLLKESILKWKELSLPDSRTVARVIYICAEIISKVKSADKSTHEIAYEFLDCLIADDQQRLEQNTEQPVDELFMIRVLFRLLELKHKKLLDGRNAIWTTSLEGRELELFALMANSYRMRSRSQSVLFDYYMNHDKFHLAIRLAPSLTIVQLITLYKKLKEPELSLFVTQLRAPSYPEDIKEAFCSYLSEENTEASLLLIQRIALDNEPIEPPEAQKPADTAQEHTNDL